MHSNLCWVWNILHIRSRQFTTLNDLLSLVFPIRDMTTPPFLLCKHEWAKSGFVFLVVVHHYSRDSLSIGGKQNRRFFVFLDISSIISSDVLSPWEYHMHFFYSITNLNHGLVHSQLGNGRFKSTCISWVTQRHANANTRTGVYSVY